MKLPTMVLVAAIHSGNLVYRKDLAVSAVLQDLKSFDATVPGKTIPDAFGGVR